MELRGDRSTFGHGTRGLDVRDMQPHCAGDGRSGLNGNLLTESQGTSEHSDQRCQRGKGGDVNFSMRPLDARAILTRPDGDPRPFPLSSRRSGHFTLTCATPRTPPPGRAEQGSCWGYIFRLFLHHRPSPFDFGFLTIPSPPKWPLQASRPPNRSLRYSSRCSSSSPQRPQGEA